MRSMGLRAILVVTTALSATNIAVAQTQQPAAPRTIVAPKAVRPDPQGAPPELVIAVAKGADKIELRRVVTRIIAMVSEIKTETGESFPQTEMRPASETQTSVVDTSTFTVSRIDGKPLVRKELLDRLAKPTPILIMEPGTQYDDRFLGMCKPDTLIFVERTPRIIAPDPSPEDGPASIAPPFVPTVVAPPVSPTSQSAKPTYVVPGRK